MDERRTAIEECIAALDVNRGQGCPWCRSQNPAEAELFSDGFNRDTHEVTGDWVTCLDWPATVLRGLLRSTDPA